MKNKSLASAIQLSFELGYTIAIPLVLLALGGRLLDNKFKTSPIFLLGGVFISFFLTTFLVYIKIAKIFAQIEEEAKEKSKNKDKVD